MSALRIVDYSENKVDSDKADIVSPTESHLVLCLNVHCSEIPGPLRKNRDVQLIIGWNERAAGARDHEPPESLQGTRGFEFRQLSNTPQGFSESPGFKGPNQTNNPMPTEKPTTLTSEAQGSGKGRLIQSSFLPYSHLSRTKTR